jgi:Protein of unknown function (DUF3891)
MLRLESPTGWWLTTHPDHARLAAAFAEHWGNNSFARPGPRDHVLHGIAVHDDGWAARDAAPQTTREGKPSAFSTELVGKYSAFEEIDLADYLAVRGRAVELVAESDAYAALLVSMHTSNLLSERADRSTIAPEQLSLLDDFLEAQRLVQERLFAAVHKDDRFTPKEKTWDWIDDQFRLLQATDNLSLLSCVNYTKPATLLHPLRVQDGAGERVAVEPLGERTFRLTPYPLESSPLKVEFPARHVEGKVFENSADLQRKFEAAEVAMLSVTITA